ncbi:hypothetical protein SAMN05421813_108131 [Daejeonella rubra]|uniref:Uncharacterized protein n=1 Tax=Daejeonella rubra TaxID=990371 RepID=A0A1G9RU61_9SPHI|nr:hypothetical protein SAMN05421813_108131 [Daejeonella rubra]
MVSEGRIFIGQEKRCAIYKFNYLFPGDIMSNRFTQFLLIKIPSHWLV